MEFQANQKYAAAQYQGSTDAPADGLKSCLLRIGSLVDTAMNLNNRLSNVVDKVGGSVPSDPNKEAHNPAPDAVIFMAKAIENALAKEAERMENSINRLEQTFS